jgi:hypothetical protein
MQGIGQALFPSAQWRKIHNLFAGRPCHFRLASESPMAIACFVLLTLVPLLPLFKVPSFSLCIARLTNRCAVLPYLAIMNSLWPNRLSCMEPVSGMVPMGGVLEQVGPPLQRESTLARPGNPSHTSGTHRADNPDTDIY